MATADSACCLQNRLCATGCHRSNRSGGQCDLSHTSSSILGKHNPPNRHPPAAATHFARTLRPRRHPHETPGHPRSGVAVTHKVVSLSSGRPRRGRRRGGPAPFHFRVIVWPDPFRTRGARGTAGTDHFRAHFFSSRRGRSRAENFSTKPTLPPGFRNRPRETLDIRRRACDD